MADPEKQPENNELLNPISPESDPTPKSAYTVDELGTLIDYYKRPRAGQRSAPSLEEAEKDVARHIIGNISERFNDPNFITFEGLLDGTAPVLQNYKNADGSPIFEGRRLTPQQIISLFGRLRTEDGEIKPIESEGSFAEGFKRKLLPGGLSFATGAAAAKTANMALQLNPGTAVPLTPPQVAARILVPAGAFVTGTLVGSEIGDLATEAIMGERYVLPSGRPDEVAGEVVGENIFYTLLPFTLSRKIDIGATSLVNNLGFTPLRQSKSLFTGKTRLTPTRSFRVLSGTEKLLNKFSNEARKRTALYLTTELGAIGGSAAAAQLAETEYPGQGGPRMLAETTGGVTGGLASELLLRTAAPGLISLYKGLGAAKDRVAEEGVFPAIGSGVRAGFEGARELVTRKQRRTERNASNFLADFIARAAREQNPDASEAELAEAANQMREQIINDLESGEFVTAFNEYARATGNSVEELTVGVASNNPFMLQLEKALEGMDAGRAIGQTRSDRNKRAKDALKFTILSLYGSGDQQAVKEAAERMQDVFEANLTNRLDNSVNNLSKAIERLRSGGDELSSEELQDLGKRLRQLVEINQRQDRARQRLLWQRVPTLEVPMFVNGETGEPQDLPNFVTVVDDLYGPDSPPEASRQTRQNLGDLFAFVKRRKDELTKGDAKLEAALEDAEGRFEAVLSNIPESALGVPDAGNIPLSGLGTGGGLQVKDYLRRLDAMDSVEEKIADINQQIAEEGLFLRDYERSLEGGDPVASEKGLEYLQNQMQVLLSKANLIRAEDAAKQAVGKDADPVNTKELQEMRSTALSLHRKFSSREHYDADSARVADAFATAFEDDLNSLPEGDNFEYDVARAFTRALKETYSKTYAGDVLSKSAAGRYANQPEELARQLGATNKEYLRAKDLDAVSQFQLNQALTGLMPEMGEEGRKLLDSLNEAALNPDTQMFDIPKLKEWVSENREQLESIPGLNLRERATAGGATIIEASRDGGVTLADNVQQILNSAADVRSTSEQILRILKSEAVDPENPEKIAASNLRKWMEKSENKKLLEAFPGIREDLDRIISGDESLLNAYNSVKLENAAARKRQKAAYSFETLLKDKYETPGALMTKVVAPSHESLGALEDLWKVVKDSPDEWESVTGQVLTKQEAIDGFRNSVLDGLMIASGAQSQDINAPKLAAMLFLPRQKAKSKGSIADWLVENEVFSESEMNGIEEIITKMVTLDNVISGGDPAKIDSLMTELGPSADLFVSILGSAAGTRLQRVFTGGSAGPGALIAAGRSASAFRRQAQKILADMPNLTKMDLLAEAFTDRELMLRLLRKGRTEKEKLGVGRKIRKLLVEKGLLGPGATGVRRAAPGILTPEEDNEGIPVSVPPAPVAPRPALKPAPDTPGKQSSLDVPQFMPQLAQAAQPAANPPRPTGQANPQQRAGLATLFPNDPILGVGRNAGRNVG